MATMTTMNEEAMHPDVLSMYRATNRAKLPAHLVTALLQVARSTLYLWYAGGVPATKYHSRIKKLTEVANLAVEAELLPTHPSAVDVRLREALSRYKETQ